MEQKEIQFKTRSKILVTKQGHALSFGFRLGPMAFFVIANLPQDTTVEDGPLVYIKLNLRVNTDWQYSVESQPRG